MQSFLFGLLVWLTQQSIHAEYGLFVHLELDWLCPLPFFLGMVRQGLRVHCRTICKKRFIVHVVFFTVLIASFEPSCIVEEPLIIRELLVGRLGLSKSDLLTNIPLLLLDLFLSLCAYFFHTILSLDLPHAMVSKLLSFFIIFFLIFLNNFPLIDSFNFLSCLQSSVS